MKRKTWGEHAKGSCHLLLLAIVWVKSLSLLLQQKLLQLLLLRVEILDQVEIVEWLEIDRVLGLFWFLNLRFNVFQTLLHLLGFFLRIPFLLLRGNHLSNRCVLDFRICLPLLFYIKWLLVLKDFLWLVLLTISSTTCCILLCFRHEVVLLAQFGYLLLFSLNVTVPNPI